MRRWLPLAGLLAAAGGCCPPQYVSPDRLDRGLAIVLTGIEGRSCLNEGVCRGLNDGGVNWAIELVDWTNGMPGAYLLNLRHQARNRRQAEQVADRIVRYRLAYPGRPVVLIGQSGGTALAVWAAEALPPGQAVDGLVLLAAALSPDYPLTTALGNCRRGVISFHFRRDWLFLGAGTTLWGTMDGQHSPAAGKEGFRVPAGEHAARLYEKLFQVALHEQGAQPRCLEPHIATSAHRFVTRYVAPLVLADPWDRDTRRRIFSGKAVEGPPDGGR